MLTSNLQYDILNLLVGEADFLCQHTPLVCEERHTVNPTNRRTRGFLLEGEMPKGIRGFQKGHPIFKGSEKGWFKKGFHPSTEIKKGQFLGEKHPMWKGGRYIDKSGYVYIYRPEHPFSDVNNYIFEHRLVIEKHLGRYLTPKEVTHHLGKRNDNRSQNLMAFANHSAHLRFEGGGIIKPEEIIYDGRQYARDY